MRENNDHLIGRSLVGQKEKYMENKSVKNVASYFFLDAWALGENFSQEILILWRPYIAREWTFTHPWPKNAGFCVWKT